MNVKFYVRALLCFYLSLSLHHLAAQELKVGDTLPPELWSLPLQVLNHPDGKETITLNEYKGKLIILDFWATWCGPCVAMLPKHDSLQKQFKDQIQIIPVTYESAEVVSSFMEKYERRKGIHIDLPDIINNQSLKLFFEHGTIPHYIWIKKGEVKAITGLDEVKGEKIAAMLQEENSLFKTKVDVPSIGYSPRQLPLMDFLVKNRPELLDMLSFRSMLSPYIPGLGSGRSTLFRPTESSPFWRITLSNLALFSLYQYAYGEWEDFTNLSMIHFETADSLKFRPSPSAKQPADWIRNNAYCYELVAPKDFGENVFSRFRSDLQNAFPQYTATVENRRTRVMALEYIGLSGLKPSTDSIYRHKYDGFLFEYTAGTLKRFVKILNTLYLSGISAPIVDRTGFKENTDLILEANISDLKDLNIALKKYDLRLIEKLDTIPILVIKDTQYTSIP